ncbi:hypothetical protein BJ085DRAFT_34126, partial [Dimargaris cristalligena]
MKSLGAYTSARTFDQHSLIDFHGHTRRLSNSLASILEEVTWTDSQGEPLRALAHYAELPEADTPDPTALFVQLTCDPQLLERLVVPMIRRGLTAFWQPKPSLVEEAKVTICLAYDEKDHLPICAVHVCPLIQPLQTRCSVEVYPATRHNPSAKDTQWVRDRQSLGSRMKPGVNEVLLLDQASGELFEGLSSNFLVVEPGEGPPGVRLVTAPMGSVLLGTILKLVLQICQDQHIPVEYRCPTLAELRGG